LTKLLSPVIKTVFFWLLVVDTAVAETPLRDVPVGQFTYLKGQVIESVQSGADFWLRVNITRSEYGNWSDTIVVTYRAVSPLQDRIREKTIIGFQGWHRGKTSYQTVLGATLQLPLFEACLLWNEDDALRFAPPRGCGWQPAAQ
jgi:hypothetical protein